MSKQLIIAEKPSVAQDIARALGGFTKEKDYFESDDYVLSSAVGHLLELAVPEEFEVKRGKWTFAHLPVIPPHFAVKPIEKTLRAARRAGLLQSRDYATQIEEAVQEGVISTEDADALRVMIDLRRAVVRVDSFEHYGKRHALQGLRGDRARIYAVKTPHA